MATVIDAPMATYGGSGRSSGGGGLDSSSFNIGGGYNTGYDTGYDSQVSAPTPGPGTDPSGMVGGVLPWIIGGSAIAALLGTYLSADAAKDASADQSAALMRGQDIQLAQSAIAGEEVRASLDPAKQELMGGVSQAQDYIKGQQQLQLRGLDWGLRDQTNAITSGYGSGSDTLSQAQEAGLGRITSGATEARQDLQQGLASGLGEVEQYAGTGEQALQQEAALSGALGPEAQAQAIQNFTESPGQKYLREQQEQALLRNSAAIGGLGGGNVRTALQEQAFGIASTDQQRVLENLRSLAGRGQTAATTQAGLQTQGASGLAQLAAQQGISEADLIKQMQGAIASGQIQQGQMTSDITGQNAINRANILGSDKTNIANMLANQGAGLSGMTTANAQTLANLAVNQGTQQAQIASDIGSAQAAGLVGQANAYNQGLQSLSGLGGLAAVLYSNQK